ncbi:MAG: (d)CMP kinase [Dehalococcoidia bacterium]|nr:(d)CMP kinase [Dehalococcoidia bacterium]
MSSPIAVTIDGPSGAGKSVVGRLLAHRLGYTFVDTGAMYRAVTWLALQRGLNPADETALGRLAEQTRIEITRPSVEDGRAYSVFVDDQDITWAIRGSDVEGLVSVVSSIPGVREALVAQQRVMGNSGGIVMVGRDIGTVVLPQAELKIYLTASPGERARRRFLELAARGEEVDQARLHDEMVRRDRIDSERTHSPLRPAEDAHVVDTEDRTVDEVVMEIECLLPLT